MEWAVLLPKRVRAMTPLFVTHARSLCRLIQYPQFACLPGRGTWNAINRVTQHVREVQALLHQWRCDASKVRGPDDIPTMLWWMPTVPGSHWRI